MKRVIVLGASRGIGAELVKQFSELGHEVLALSRSIERMDELFGDVSGVSLAKIDLESHDFKQEFSEEAKVAEFCSTEYGVDFPMFATAKVTGENAHPFYKKLIAASGKEPRWNFAKYLIDRNGEVVDHYKSRVTPESEKLVSAIQSVL